MPRALAAAALASALVMAAGCSDSDSSASGSSAASATTGAAGSAMSDALRSSIDACLVLAVDATSEATKVTSTCGNAATEATAAGFDELAADLQKIATTTSYEDFSSRLSLAGKVRTALAKL